MKLSFLILFFIPLITLSQSKKGSLKFFVEKHGFKEIILGNDLSTISGSIKKATDTAAAGIDGIVMYEVTNPDILKVGENIKLKSLLIAAFKNKIVYIIIASDKENGIRLNETFKEAYGKPNSQPNRFMDKWLWTSKQYALCSDLNSSTEDSFIFMDSYLQDEVDSFNKDKAKKAASEI